MGNVSPCQFALLVALLMCLSVTAGISAEDCRLLFKVTSDLTFPNVPLDPMIDFAEKLKVAGVRGRVDLNSIRVINRTTGRRVPHALSEEFAYGDRGRVQWVTEAPKHREFEIRFRVAPTRQSLKPAAYTPLIGTGDLLRYNAGVPRPISLIYLTGLVDLTGDGKPDLIGCWNYAHRPGLPWDGIFCFPRVGSLDKLEFGDPVRLRYVDRPGSREFHTFSQVYMHADIADLNGDGRPDAVYSPSRGSELLFYLSSGERDDGGFPIFVAAGSAPRPSGIWSPCRAVDLNGDGAMDFVVGEFYLRNRNPRGWPVDLAEPVRIDVGEGACFYDVDGDGRLDAVCLVDASPPEPWAKQVAWRRNLGGDPPKFAPPEILEDIDCWWCTSVAAVREGSFKGLLVGHNVWQEITLFRQSRRTGQRYAFRRAGRAESLSATLTLSDQAWPCGCHWDGDDDVDLLVGGGYGWPRILMNEGSIKRPAFAEPRTILSEGKHIRFLRDEVLGGKYWHNMGYPYPVFVDWDGDGLPDLVVPNETNRIFWYKNVGTRSKPVFGPRRQIVCDGYPDSPELRARTAALASREDVPNSPYPAEKEVPFFWRTGAGFADFNGDGIMDMITHDGFTHKLTLFVQYRDAEGNLRLQKDRPLQINDGRLIDDTLVGRSAHWTESFRCVDWDGDGLIDIVYSLAGMNAGKSSIYLLRNCGTKQEPVFEPPVPLCCFGEPIRITDHGPHPWAGDLNGDGLPDLLACAEWSVYPFYSYAALRMKERPTFELEWLRPVVPKG